MRAMRTVVVVKVLPLGQPLLKVNVALVTQELVELLLIRAVRSLNLPLNCGVRGLM